MAKGKHAAALFEVIHAGNTQTREKRRGLLRTPKWWFKSRSSAPMDSSATAEAQPQTSATPVEAGAIASVPPPPSRPPAVDMLVDPQRHQITFRVSYTSAIVSAFAIIVALVLAFLMGRHTGQGPAHALAGPTTEQIRQGPPQPQVLDVQRGGNNPAQRSAIEPENAMSANMGTGANATAPAPDLQSARRTVGLNYVIIQGYPDEASAKAALSILHQHNVGATIEKGLRGFTKDWYIVAGTQGFARIRSQEYEDYLARIQQISDKFAKSRRSFKAFEPLPYKWDRP